MGLLAVETKNAVKAPPTEKQFIDIILEEGSERAAKVFDEIRATDPQYSLFKEATLNILGYQLIQEGKVKESLGVFKLIVEAYPQSWNTYDSLGEVYQLNGDRELYQKSLELNPQNTNAVEMLKKLTGK